MGTGMAYVLLYLVAGACERAAGHKYNTFRTRIIIKASRSGFPEVDANGQGTCTGTELA